MARCLGPTSRRSSIALTVFKSANPDARLPTIINGMSTMLQQHRPVKMLRRQGLTSRSKYRRPCKTRVQVRCQVQNGSTMYAQPRHTRASSQLTIQKHHRKYVTGGGGQRNSLPEVLKKAQKVLRAGRRINDEIIDYYIALLQVTADEEALSIAFARASSTQTSKNFAPIPRALANEFRPPASAALNGSCYQCGPTGLPTGL